MRDVAVLTGAAGFVGSHVLRHLMAETEWDVVCPVSFWHKGVPERIEVALSDHPEWWARITVCRAELTAPFSPHLTETVADCRWFLNLASESHVDRSIAEPAGFVSNNVELMLQVLEAARKMRGLRTFVHISTDEVYGPAPDGILHDEWSTIVPSNPYSASKAAQEAIAISYWRTYGVPLVLTNTMNIIGETQDPEKFVPMVLRKVLKDEPVPIHASPDGRVGSRFYLHARNQADALLFLCRQVQEGLIAPLRSDEARPPRFHIVGEREVSNLDMARAVAEAAQKELVYTMVDFHSSRPGHDLRYALSGEKLAALGWKAPVPLDESLERTVHWTLANPQWLEPSTSAVLV